MKNTTKKLENSAIFSACHSLTKKLVSGTQYDYKSTFSASLALFYRDFTSFCVSCAAYDVDVLPVSNCKFSKMDFFGNVEKMDISEEAAAAVKNAINYSVFYGLSKREANISRQEVYQYKIYNTDIPSDAVAPVIVKNMKQNEIDDIKQDVFIYLLKRQEKENFRSLPYIVQMMRAGDAVVTSHYNKIIRETVNNSFSLDDEAFYDVPKNDKYSSGVEAIIDKLVSNVPKLHRDIARNIIELRYLGGRKNKNISEISKILNVSERKIKQVISEMKNGLTYDDFIECLN